MQIVIALSSEELIAKYGTPTFYEWRENSTVYVSLHKTEESARAFANSNNSKHKHIAWVEKAPHDAGWLSITDLRPALAQLDRKGKNKID